MSLLSVSSAVKVHASPASGGAALAGPYVRFLGVDEAPQLVALDMPATLDALHVLRVVLLGSFRRIGEQAWLPC